MCIRDSDKVCGDALSGKVMRTLERLDADLAQKVKHDAQGMPSWGVTFVAPSGRALRCLLYTSPSPRDRTRYRMPSSA